MAKDTVTVDRYKYIGGSDIPIIMGLSNFKTRWQLAREKAQIVEPDFNGNVYTRYGDTMEPKIRDYINKEFDLNYQPLCLTPNDYVRINVDGYDAENYELLEVKTTSRENTGRQDTMDYIVQCIWYMHWIREMKGIEEYPACRLAIYKRPDDMDEELNPMLLSHGKIYFHEHEGLIEKIFETVDKFLELVALLRVKPETEEIETLPAEIQTAALKVFEFEDKLTALKETENQLKEARKELYDVMMSNRIKSFKSYNGVGVTLVLPTEATIESAFDLETFKENHPKYFLKYQKEKLKKGRAGYVRIIQ